MLSVACVTVARDARDAGDRHRALCIARDVWRELAAHSRVRAHGVDVGVVVIVIVFIVDYMNVDSTNNRWIIQRSNHDHHLRLRRGEDVFGVRPHDVWQRRPKGVDGELMARFVHPERVV